MAFFELLLSIAHNITLTLLYFHQLLQLFRILFTLTKLSIQMHQLINTIKSHIDNIDNFLSDIFKLTVNMFLHLIQFFQSKKIIKR